MLGLSRRPTRVYTCVYLIIVSMSLETKGLSWLTNKNHLEHQAETSKNLPAAINSMSGCAIRVFNFIGIDYKGSYLNAPIILLKYYKLPSLDWWMLIPQEIDPRNKTAISQYLTDDTKRSLHDLYDTSNASPDISFKNGICEAKIYLYPPNVSSASYLYFASDEDIFLNDPQLMQIALNSNQHRWRTDYFSSTLKVYLLVCQKIDDSVLEALANTIQVYPTFSQFNPLLLIWETMGDKFYYRCDYCNKCAPYQVIRIEKLPSTKFELDQILDLQHNYPPPFFSNVLSSYNHRDQIIDQGFYKNRLNVMKSSRLVDITMLSSFQFDLEIHLTALLAPDNATIEVTNIFLRDKKYWKQIELNECAENNGKVWYAAASRPGFKRFTGSTYLSFPVKQLILRKDRLRFISCHREEISWIHNLRELAVALDLATWCILVFTIVVYWLLNILFHKIYLWVCNSEEIPKKRLFDVGFQLSSSLLDQSVNLFQNPNITQNCITWWAFIFLAIMLSTLSNLYKGENITSLTVPPPLVAFDTFELLVKNKFDVYTLPHQVGGGDELMLPQDAEHEREFLQSNDHEAFPVVSQLWYFINLQWSKGWKTLDQFLNDKSLGVSDYFKNSKLFPTWPSATGLGVDFPFEQLVSPHLENCDHSAVILEEKVARIVYTNFSVSRAPAFMGNDVIFEHFKGLSLFGHFDKRTISRINLFGESGIVDWWKKYFADSLDLFAYLIHVQNNGTNASKVESVEASSNNIMGLAIIPCIGLSAAMIIFIVLENGINIRTAFGNGSLSYCGFVNRNTTLETVKTTPVLQVVE